LLKMPASIRLTTEETIEMRARMAATCGLLAHGKLYLLEGDLFCDACDWQPDFDASQAFMVAEKLFLIGELMFQRQPDGSMRYQYNGVADPERPFIRTDWYDSASEAIYQGVCQAMGALRD